MLCQLRLRHHAAKLFRKGVYQYMSEYLLEMKNIEKSFSGVHALDHVNFAVRPGKVMCLAGENGCGKSTLVKIISGVYTKDEGEVLFQGEKITKITTAEATRLGIQ